MRIALANIWCDPGWRDADAVFAGAVLQRELARRIAAAGHEVHVVQEFPTAAARQDGPVHWHLVPPSRLTRSGRAALRAAGRAEDALPKTPADALVAAVAAVNPDLVHSFDLCFYPTLLLFGRLPARLVAHFHGGSPARLRALQHIERQALARVDRLLFTTHERGQEWVTSGALPDDERIVEVFESSTLFTPGPNPHRLRGRPAVLHTGRLDGVKDPVTTVNAFRRFRAAHPDAVLSLAYREAPLLDVLRAAAAGLPVDFLGHVADPEALYRSADLFVQASVREVCGLAPLEALACGRTVVLSDIPPFRRLTDHGRQGRLFPVGDVGAMAAAMATAASAPTASEVVRGWFDSRLSFDRLAEDVLAVYQSLRSAPTRTPA